MLCGLGAESTGPIESMEMEGVGVNDLEQKTKVRVTLLCAHRVEGCVCNKI